MRTRRFNHSAAAKPGMMFWCYTKGQRRRFAEEPFGFPDRLATVKTQTKIDAVLTTFALLVVVAIADMNNIWRIVAFVIGCLLLLIVITVPTQVCAWLGHVVIRVVTFGRVDLAWKRGSESILTNWIGLFSLLAISGLVAWVIQR